MITSQEPKQTNSAPPGFWNGVAFLALSISLFFLLTSGLPLAQMGLFEATSSKKVWVKLVRVGVLPFFILLGFLEIWRPQVLRSLWLTKAFYSLCEKHYTKALIAFFLCYVAVMATVGWARHAALETRAFDLGIFAQAVWNTLQGDFLYSSLKEGICLLGDHVSPSLLFTAPFYALWPDPRMLVLLQAIAAGSCLFLIAKITFEKTASKPLALIFAFLYCFYFPTRGALHEDFHPELLVEPFIFAAFLFLERKRLLPFLACLVIVATGKENMLGVTFFLGLYAALFKSWRLLGAGIMAVSLGLFLFEVKWLIPTLSQKTYLYEGFYWHLLTGPWYGWFQAFANEDVLEYLMKVFLPFLFLSFFHFPTLLLTAPILLQNLLSNNPVFRSFNYHYTTGLTPFVFISAIYGLQVVLHKFSSLKKKQVLLIGALVMVGLMRSGAAEYYYYWQSKQNETPERIEIRNALKSIAEQKSVLTHNNLIAQIPNRKEVYQFDYHQTPTKAQSARDRNADVVILSKIFWEPNSAPYEQTYDELIRNGYAPTLKKQGFAILEKQ